MNFEIRYHKRVVKEDIPRLSSVWKRSIQGAIEEKLTTQPELYGVPLRSSLRGYRKLRVGDYRVVFRIEGNAVVVLLIQHRSVAYKIMRRRI